MRLFIPDSPRRELRLVQQAAARRGHQNRRQECRAAFVRLVNYGPHKNLSMAALLELKSSGVPTIPEAVAINLYDDKLAQVEMLQEWMPATHIMKTKKDAAAEMPALPFVSKSAHGSASKNVRMINTKAEAEKEIKAAFGRGIAAANGPQKGYLIWQEFVADNSGDVRVCVTGDYLFGLVRHNREGSPFASGSGSHAPIIALDARTRPAFEMATQIADKIGSRWCCFDFVFADGQPYCLEVSFAWTETAYGDCAMFDRALDKCHITGSHWPEIAIDELERLAHS